MQTCGTGMRFRSDIGTRWPENRGWDEGEKVPEVLPPLHLCEVPESMYAKREKMASKWAGLTHGAFLVPVAKAPAKKAPAKRSRKAA